MKQVSKRCLRPRDRRRGETQERTPLPAEMEDFRACVWVRVTVAKAKASREPLRTGDHTRKTKTGRTGRNHTHTNTHTTQNKHANTTDGGVLLRMDRTRYKTFRPKFAVYRKCGEKTHYKFTYQKKRLACEQGQGVHWNGKKAVFCLLL